MNYADTMKNKTKINWDNVNIQYPVRKFPSNGRTSYQISHEVRGQPEITRREVFSINLFIPVACVNLQDVLAQLVCPNKGKIKFLNRNPEEELLKNYSRDYNVLSQLTRSQTNIDFEFKPIETHVLAKPSPCSENLYLYPPSRKLESVPVRINSHNTTEMRSNFEVPNTAPRLVTNKNQYKLPITEELPPEQFQYEPTPILTSDEGFEKLLDPYLTSSRLHHRPFTSDQLNRQSNRRDIVTYYTLADLPWIHSPKPSAGEWWLSKSWPRAIYDREKFKQGFREIIVHNKPNWVPGSFRTEIRDNYVQRPSRTKINGELNEANIAAGFHGAIKSAINKECCETKSIQDAYITENEIVGSGKGLSAVIDQHVVRNKRSQLKGFK